MTKLEILSLFALVCVVSSYPSAPVLPHKQPDGYFMYLNVPRHKEYEAGFNRGNDKHYISRFDQVKDHRFRTRVKWADAHDGHGEHYFEYNHAPKHPEPYHAPHHDKGYGHEPHHVPVHHGYSAPEIVVKEPIHH